MTRDYGALSADETTSRIGPGSILCLPIGSCEQHGPHLPLNTDAVIAEGFSRRLAEHHGDRYDLWILPAIPYGLSLEHSWAPGTVSLRIKVLAELLHTLAGEYVRATRARRLLIVNGHGGNRGILEAVLYELAESHGIAACAVNPYSLSSPGERLAVPEIHAGIRETSIMLALNPSNVHLDRLGDAETYERVQPNEINRQIRTSGVTWPWNSGDPRIAVDGVIGGDSRQATAEHGESILRGALDNCAEILDQL